MRRSPPPPRAKENFDLDKEGLVAVVAVGVAGAAAYLGFKSVSSIPLVSLSSLKGKISSEREGSSKLSVPIRTATSCKCEHKG